MNKKENKSKSLCLDCRFKLRVHGEILTCNNVDSDHYTHLFFDKHFACDIFDSKIKEEYNIKEGYNLNYEEGITDESI